jgi:hypothetical protein
VADWACRKGVVQRQRGAPGHTKDGVDAAVCDGFDQGIGGTHP